MNVSLTCEQLWARLVSQFPFGDEKHLRVARRDGSWSGPTGAKQAIIQIGDWWTVSFTIHLVLFCRECVENGQKIHFSCLAALILAPEFNSFHSKSTSSSILKSWWFVNQQLLSLKQTHSPQPGLLGSGSSEVTNEPSPWGQRWSNGWYGYLSQN